MEMAKPQAEHQWLQKLVGEWTSEGEADMGPDKPPMKSKGSERVRSLGGLWVICDGQGEMPGGGQATMVMTLGFDPKKNRYVGTWVGSMMTNMWVYEGTVDPSGKILTLDTTGPSFTDPNKTAKYQDIIEFVTDDHRLLRSRTQGDDGKWNEFMKMHYRRTK
jgi:Protein of unknown function (DUF1579)